MSSKRKRMSAAERREVIELSARDVFAERGYHGASMDEIAKRSGVTPPVVYDHFPSKLALHRRLLERTRDELLEMWREHLGGDEPAQDRIPRALDAWTRYVQGNPYAPRMFFMETTGDPEIRRLHDDIQAQARVALGVIIGSDLTEATDGPGLDQRSLEMTAEVMRAGLTGLAIWWADHPEVPREQIVAVALNTIWVGFERVSRGEGWEPPAAGG